MCHRRSAGGARAAGPRIPSSKTSRAGAEGVRCDCLGVLTPGHWPVTASVGSRPSGRRADCLVLANGSSRRSGDPAAVALRATRHGASERPGHAAILAGGKEDRVHVERFRVHGRRRWFGSLSDHRGFGPAWSPDGSRLAYMADTQDAGDESLGVYVVAAELGAVATELVEIGALRLDSDWSGPLTVAQPSTAGPTPRRRDQNSGSSMSKPSRLSRSGPAGRAPGSLQMGSTCSSCPGLEVCSR